MRVAWGLPVLFLVACAATSTQSAPANGIPAYGDQMSKVLQNNPIITTKAADAHLSGKALIKIEVAPNGYVVAAQIAASSGNPLVDQVAILNVMHASFGEFTPNMPQKPI